MAGPEFDGTDELQITEWMAAYMSDVSSPKVTERLIRLFRLCAKDANTECGFLMSRHANCKENAKKLVWLADLKQFALLLTRNTADLPPAIVWRSK